MGTGFNTRLLTTVFQQTICQVRSLLRMLLCKWRMVCACQVAMSTTYKRENSITLTHHTLLEIPSFPFLKPPVCKHIPHQYSKGMAYSPPQEGLDISGGDDSQTPLHLKQHMELNGNFHGGRGLAYSLQLHIGKNTLCNTAGILLDYSYIYFGSFYLSYRHALQHQL